MLQMEEAAETSENQSASVVMDTPDPKFIEINVGGKLFACSTATLLRYPGSRLASFLNPKTDDTEKLLRDPEDHIFIDRDPDVFMFVLEFLRNGRLSVASYSVDLLERIDADAKYFGIQPLEQAILEARQKLDPDVTKENTIRITSARPESVLRHVSPMPAEPREKTAIIGFIEYSERLAVLSTVGREPHTQVSLTGKMSLLEALMRLVSYKRPQFKSALDDLRDRSLSADEVTVILLSPPLLKRAAFNRLDCFRIWLADLLIPFASLPITTADANSKRYLWPMCAEPTL